MNQMETFRKIIKEIRDHRESLNEWESSFISHIDNKLTSGYGLSVKQELKLGDIYKKATGKK
jgi:hypothetical protein